MKTLNVDIYESHIDDEKADRTFFQGPLSLAEAAAVLAGYAALDIELIGHGEGHACWETRSLYLDRDVTVIVSFDWEGELTPEERAQLGVDEVLWHLLDPDAPDPFGRLLTLLGV